MARRRAAAGLPVCPVAPVTTIMMFASARSTRSRTPLRLVHGNLDARFADEADGFGVARIGVSRDAESGIVSEDALDAPGHFFRAIGDDHLAGMLLLYDDDATA